MKRKRNERHALNYIKNCLPSSMWEIILCKKKDSLRIK